MDNTFKVRAVKGYGTGDFTDGCMYDAKEMPSPLGSGGGSIWWFIKDDNRNWREKCAITLSGTHYFERLKCKDASSIEELRSEICRLEHQIEEQLDAEPCIELTCDKAYLVQNKYSGYQKILIAPDGNRGAIYINSDGSITSASDMWVNYTKGNYETLKILSQHEVRRMYNATVEGQCND